MMLENLKNNKGVIKLILMLLMVTFFMMISQISYAAASDMITEWTIPSDNTTIKLPVQGTGLNITVDWGDGTDTENVITSFPAHIYEKAGTYEITVSGTCPKWGYARVNTVSSTSNSDYYTYTQYLTKVKQFGELGAQQYGFAHCTMLTEVSGENLVTSKTFEKTTSMAYMFYGCSKLISVDVSKFDTSKVTNMFDMFYNCRALTSLDLSKFDTSKVTNMLNMFGYCKGLTSLDVSGFDTSNVKYMGSMFSDCSSLTSLDLSNFNTSNVTEMSGMFSNCSSLTSLDLSNFNTSNVTKMRSVFSGCSQLTSLDLSNFNTSNVTEMSYMFYNCSALTSLDVSNFDTSNVTNMGCMFYECSNLVSLDVSNFDTSNVTGMHALFAGCASLTSLDVSNFDTSNVTNMGSMFSVCSSLTGLNVSNFDTSNVTNMGFMFSGCSALKNLDVSNFNTSKVTDMGVMFQNCSTLKNLNLNNFDTSNVTDMGYMFSGCSALKNLDVSNFNTSKVTEMDRMFWNCSSLISLNLSNFDTSNVVGNFNQGMEDMFSGCLKLTSLDLSNFDTSKIANMKEMFKDCTNLKSLQLSEKFKIPMSNTTNMFTNTSNLKSIILVDSTPLAGQFASVRDQLNGKTIYVPNKAAEVTYEEAWSGDFSGDRIQPILELVGDEKITINKGEAYLDAGYTVAGLDIADAQYYNCYGYSVAKIGSISPSNTGTYTIKYQLKRTENAVATTVEEVTRTIEIIDIDIIPPKGVISIINGTMQNGTITVKSTEIKIGVTATDNVSKTDQIKIYVVLDQVPDTEKIPDSSMENYTDGYTKTLTVSSGAKNTIVYVVLKDAMGNTNTIFKGTNTSYKLKYDANGGTDAPAEETAYFGMPYKVTLKKPNYEGKYFLGWSTNKNANVASYLQNDTIPANIFAGTSSDVTLYAIWTDSIEKLPLLTDRAKIGDYINYPVSYENKGFDYYTNKSKLTGWRVISKDTDINGTSSEGTINIISAGIPMAENWYITSKDFLFDDFINGNKYQGCGFINKNLNSIFFNKYTVINNNIPAVRSVNLTDIENITGISGIALNTSLTDEKYNNLLNVGSLYELATRYSTNALYNVTDAGLLSQGQSQAGVRPVVELKNVVRTDGMDETGAWSIKIAASEEIPDQIQITFDPVGGTVTPTTKLASYLGTYGELPVPTKDKYEFVGWYTERDYLTKVSETTTVDSPYNITLYAKWIPLGSFIKLTTSTLTTGNEYIITYNGAVALMEGEVSSKVSVFSGEVTPENDVIYTNDERMIWVYEKASSSNGGYFTNKHTNDQLILGGADVYGATKGNVLIYSNNTLKTPPTSNIYNPTSTYLIYLNNKFGSKASTSVPQGSSPIYLYEQKNQVMFEPNGGTVTPTAKDITKGSAYGELPTPSKDGYIFVGWFTDDNPAEEIKSTTIVSKTGSHTLYAHWATSGTKYTITYDANGGSGAPAIQTKEVNQSITISTIKPTRTNYIFMGWNTKKDGSGKTYNAGETYSTNADLTLYAHWQGRGVTVTLNGNGGSYVKQNGDYAQTKTITVTYGSAYGSAIDDSTWYKTDYDFVGWYTSPTGGSPVSAYTAVSNANDHTLYAHWKASESSGGGTGGGTGGVTSCTGSFVVTSDTHVSCPSCGMYSSDSDVHLITETCNKCGASTTYYSGICTCSGFKTTSPSRIHK